MEIPNTLTASNTWQDLKHPSSLVNLLLYNMAATLAAGRKYGLKTDAEQIETTYTTCFTDKPCEKILNYLLLLHAGKSVLGEFILRHNFQSFFSYTPWQWFAIISDLSESV